MTSLIEGLKKLGGPFLKGLTIESFIDYFHPQLIAEVRDLLSTIKKEDIPGFVKSGQALPIPLEAFGQLKGLEDYLETIEPQRLFLWLQEARPDLAEALEELDVEGAEYMVKFKGFMVDSIKSLKESTKSLEESTGLKEGDVEGPPSTNTKKLTCDKCKQTWPATLEEAAELKNCPFCGEPA